MDKLFCQYLFDWKYWNNKRNLTFVIMKISLIKQCRIFWTVQCPFKQELVRLCVVHCLCYHQNKVQNKINGEIIFIEVARVIRIVAGPISAVRGTSVVTETYLGQQYRPPHERRPSWSTESFRRTVILSKWSSASPAINSGMQYLWAILVVLPSQESFDGISNKIGYSSALQLFVAEMIVFGKST